MAHREGIRAFMKDVVFENTSVVDWGCGTKKIINYVTVGKNVEYFSIDKLSHVGASLVTEIDNPGIRLGKLYDSAVCLEVLEHTKDPATVLQNIYENLKPGGVLYLSIPFLYRVHSDEDYWRFTDQGLYFLLTKSGFAIEKLGATEETPLGPAGWIVRAIKK